MRTLTRVLLTLGLIISGPLAAVPAAQATAPLDERTLSPAVRAQAQAELDAVRLANPEDYLGIDRVLRKYGAKPMVVRLNGIDRTLTADEAMRVLNDRRPARSAGGVVIQSVPSDAFSVGISIYGSFIPAGGRIISGSWNFRDDYVNGSDPDDALGILANVEGCYRVRSNAYTFHAYDYAGGDHSSLGWLSDGGLDNGSVGWGMNDMTSGFKLYTDHGTGSVQYDPINSGCAYHEIGGEAKFEHNQDGGGTWSLSIAWGLFALNYTGAPSHLQKSSGAMYY